MSDSLAMLRLAVRRLARSPILASAAVLTLMLGIGATTAVFSVLNAVLIRPLPYRESDRLVDLSHTIALTGLSRVDQSDATYLLYRQANRVFTDIGAYRETAVSAGGTHGANAADAGLAERVSAAVTSASTFGVLGATPLLGRTLGQSDDVRGAPPVVL